MNPLRLFRKSVLEKMASPERLDEQLEVVQTWGWISAFVLALMLALVLGWSVIGHVPVKIEGKGILIRGGSVLPVQSGVEGRILSFEVEVGDVVLRNQEIATVERPELKSQRESLMEKWKEAKAMAQQNRSFGGAIATDLANQRARLMRQLQDTEDLLARGLVVPAEITRIQQQITQIDQTRASQQSGGLDDRTKVNDIERKLFELDAQMTAKIVSLHSGRVIERKATVGDRVTPQSAILTVEPENGELQALIYIPATEGKKIKADAGQEVRISPSNYRNEEYGHLKADVARVSEFPVSAEAMRNALRDEKLLETLTGKGSFFELQARLRQGPTPSGFLWSKQEGPNGKVYGGTLCTAWVVVEQRRPISFVFEQIGRLFS